ncbi:MAG: penicillin acylase family protein [Gemmatimonadetes bacterium]|nr:penicillin acylase family protein [Gemmatimonadota bacterium]MDA1102562.1 penicillin acylase family protein [Gemmatimonadota bacterium]
MIGRLPIGSKQVVFGAAAALALLPLAASAQQSERLDIDGLDQAVEILVDRWGISHIYAQTEHDLFFAQGWNAARDRLFQLELWRRQATGTVSEILGARELERDIGTRLFKFRRDLDQELNHYHDNGVGIVNAYVDGINAYIGQTARDPSLLTLEFELLGITPGLWTPDVVISRHQGLLGNIGAELSTGRLVAQIGSEPVKALSSFGPGDPLLELDPALDGAALSEDILGLYDAFRASVRFLPEDIVPGRRADQEAFAALERSAADAGRTVAYDEAQDVGSNNWVVSGSRSESGYPIMANDPHRAQGAPSLRYWVHLVGPGWNVIGGGEPSLPGVSIGHNEFGAWGLTVFATDGEDLYVYETNPSQPNQYRYRGAWESMTVLTEEIPVKGARPHTAELKYTRHGPVVFEDRDRNLAYAVRAAWMEVGGAPYLASLRMDQSETWEDFREASNYSNIPGENMIWADRKGTIGWQAVGIAPVRRNWSGLVPVPGDGRYEWDGYLPITAKPNTVNPPEGYFATANNDLIPRDYPYMDAIGFSWSDPYRWARIAEVLGGGRQFSMADMMRLQTDELSLPARQLVPLLDDLSASGEAEEARLRLLDWDHVLDKRSVEAGIYVTWEAELRRVVRDALVPDGVDLGLSLQKVIEALVIPPGSFGSDPLAARDHMLVGALETTVASLSQRFGPDPSGWELGRPGYHHAYLRHPLGTAVNAETRALFEVGPQARGGYGSTVNQTGNGANQTSGASFRIIVDTSDWDRAVGMNTPGQSGDVRSPFYRNLFERWANDEFHPVFYSRDRVEEVTARRIDLRPIR